MNSSTNAAVSFSQATSPAELSDTELLAATRRLVGRSNQLLAALLEHLGEVEARGIHRTRACSGHYAYCIFELRFSEDEAYRRVAASRLVRRFPALLAAIASGELHLTGLLQLGPHLTGENLREVLDRAKHRTKKEIARLVRVLDPLPDVLPRIEPLGPASATLVPRTPTWPEFVASMCPVRDLAPGERPRDWTEGTLEAGTFEGPANFAGHEGAPGPAWPIELDASAESAPARLEPQRYGIQFTANEEYVKLVAEAHALLSRSAPRATLDELHLRDARPRRRAQAAEVRRYGPPAEAPLSNGPAWCITRGSVPAARNVRNVRVSGRKPRHCGDRPRASGPVCRSAPARKIRPGCRPSRRLPARRRALHVHRGCGATLPRDPRSRASPRDGVRPGR
jgi:hypothetical protein